MTGFERLSFDDDPEMSSVNRTIHFDDKSG